MLIDVFKYSDSLKKLWYDVFGDDEAYINLLFDKGYTPAECFAVAEKDEIVSALYLLKGFINIDGKEYEGRYLYAAATAVKYRGKGLMGRIIKEAQQYIKDNNITFISLVPADKGLYRYYSSFGFETLMSRYVCSVEGKVNLYQDDKISCGEFIRLRKSLSLPHFNFDEAEMSYALSCLDYAGYRIYRNTSDSYYIADEERSEIIEYVSSVENLDYNTGILISKVNKNAVIFSPHDLSGFCKCDKKEFGMIYTYDIGFRNIINDIYMNIALD